MAQTRSTMAQTRSTMAQNRIKDAKSTHPFLQCDNFIQVNKIYSIDWNVESNITEAEQSFHMSDDRQVVFTDGSCYPNNTTKDSLGGYAAVFALGTLKDTVIYGSLDISVHFASNQRAEGMAMYQTLFFLKDRINDWNSLIIVSDSAFWISMINLFMPRWARESIDFNTKKNSDLTILLWTLYNELTIEHLKEITFRHMKSHDKDHWSHKSEVSYEYFCYTNNKYVDEFANFARLNCKPGENKIELAVYED